MQVRHQQMAQQQKQATITAQESLQVVSWSSCKVCMHCTNEAASAPFYLRLMLEALRLLSAADLCVCTVV
jgi:hypothetical protein